jgi:hypothetical protein
MEYQYRAYDVTPGGYSAALSGQRSSSPISARGFGSQRSSRAEDVDDAADGQVDDDYGDGDDDGDDSDG